MRFPSLILSILITISLHAQEGAWSGELDIQGTKLPLVFHFDPEGCTMDSPSQGATGIKAEKSYTPEGKIKVSIPVIAATFEGITNAKHEVRALSNLNHLFQHCTTGQLTEYRQIEETISPEVLDLITTWITKLN